MTADEVLQQMQALQSDNRAYCVIDPDTREISIPSKYQRLGVESDEKSERIWFQCPRIVGDNIDLSELQLRVNYQNANNQKDQYIVTDVQVDGDNIVFSWQLYRKVTAYQGSVSFIVCAVRVSGEIIQNEWNTTLATSQVLQGLEVENPEITEEESDVIAQLLQIVTNTSEQAVSDVNTAKTGAISAITEQQTDSVGAVQSAQLSAVSSVESAGELIKESLPSDYVELSDNVDEMDRTKAPAIIENASGESIKLSDSANTPLSDTHLYGKSDQETTTGANLFDISVGFGAEKSMELEAESGKKLYIMVSDTSGSRQVNYRLVYTDDSVYDAAIINANDVNGTHKTIVTLEKDIKAISIYIVSAPDLVDRTIDKAMVSISDVEIPYEPYTGGEASPSPDYPQQITIPGIEGSIGIEVAGENLFDAGKVKSSSATVIVENDGKIIRASGKTAWAQSGAVIVNVNPGEEFTASIDEIQTTGSSIIAIQYSSNNESIGSLTNSNRAKTFTVKNGETSIRIIFVANAKSDEQSSDVNAVFVGFMLSRGGSALPFEPYAGRQFCQLLTPNGFPGIPVTSGGNYTDSDGQQWICDEVDYARGKYVQRVQILDSDDLQISTYSSSYIIQDKTSSNVKVPEPKYDAMICNICNRWSESWDNNYVHMFLQKKGQKIVIIGKWTDSQEAKAVLDKGVTVVYPIETPIETDLTTEQLTALKQLRTYQTVTNITTDSEPQIGMEVEYTADTKTWIENKIQEIQKIFLN